MEDEIEQEQLVKQCKEGNISSFERLVNQYNTRVSNIIYQMLGSSSDVDDLAQEVFIKIYQHIKYFKEESKFSTWLYRITVNTVIDYFRKQKHRKTVPLDEIEPVPAAEKKDNSELKKLLQEEIKKLPVKYRTILILKDIEGLSYNEISKVLKCRIGTVESRLFRAREALREKLEKAGWWRDFI